MNEEVKDLERRIKALTKGRPGAWLSHFDERQQRLIVNARNYARNDPAGLPGHQLMLIIDKLSTLLDEHESGEVK